MMASNVVSMAYLVLRNDGDEPLQPEDVDQLRQPVAERSFPSLTWFDAGVGYLLAMIAQSVFLVLAMWQFIVIGSTSGGYFWGTLAFVCGFSRSLFHAIADKLMDDKS